MLSLQKDSGDMVLLQIEKLRRKYETYIIMYLSNVMTS